MAGLDELRLFCDRDARLDNSLHHHLLTAKRVVTDVTNVNIADACRWTGANCDIFPIGCSTALQTQRGKVHAVLAQRVDAGQATGVVVRVEHVSVTSTPNQTGRLR